MASPRRRAMTLTQKILAHHARGLSRPWVEAGDILRVKVDWTLASELAWNGMDRTYALLGRPPLHDPERFYLAVDHTVDPVTLAHDARTQRLAQLARDFAKERGLRHFYDANETILHTRFYRDLVLPGDLVLGADSHSSSHGGLGAFSIGLGGADVAAAMVLGETWLEVPEAIAVDYVGTLPFGIGGKDVILETLGTLGRNTVAMERSVEYRGEAVKHFSTDTRFTIANMTAEFGGLNGIFEADAVSADWISQRTLRQGNASGGLCFRSDEDAPYVSRHRIDLASLGPRVAKPFSPDNVFPVESVLGLPLDGVFIGACTTTEEELVLAAMLLEEAMRGQTPRAPHAKKLVVPGDLFITARLRESGLLSVYERAGFRIGPPGCSMCLGVASEKALPGEVWLSSQNRNYENRMGKGSLAWLSSAVTVAASSLDLQLTDPRPLLARLDVARFEQVLGRSDTRRSVPEVTTVEPELKLEAAGKTSPSSRTSLVPDTKRKGAIHGRVQRFDHHVDTDAIIPGEFCHLTDAVELGTHAFRHVRPGFGQRAREGRTIVVAGEGFGSGSSREQAVWALLGAGVQVVIARSFAFIHKRNLVNEALPYLVIRDDDFHRLATEDSELHVDLARGSVREVRSGRVFQAEKPSPVVLALQNEGGLVPAISTHGARVFDVLGGS